MKKREKNKTTKEVKKVKKTFITIFAVMLSIVMAYGYADALTGVCSNCHTMHNSQNGDAVAKDYQGNLQSSPNERLLKADCVACHSADKGTQRDGTNGPAVLHRAAPDGQGGTDTNAGGDFYWVDAGNSAMGHDVLDLPNVTGQDSNISSYTPPGWDNSVTNAAGDAVAGGEASWSSQLTCAGTYGCHGDHSAAGSFPGIEGAHHSNVDGQLDSASTVGNSFRFLEGIKGYEDPNWNWNETTSQHNEYYGIDDNASYANKNTISFLCAECHGLFHSDISRSSSPWTRHPTDIVLPSGTTEYADYNPDASNAYSLEAPVARPVVPSSSSATVTPGDSSTATGAIVMCLSCHRAHGSPEEDLLRWTYSSMQAGSGTSDTGCFTCHTAKNGD